MNKQVEDNAEVREGMTLLLHSNGVQNVNVAEDIRSAIHNVRSILDLPIEWIDSAPVKVPEEPRELTVLLEMEKFQKILLQNQKSVAKLSLLTREYLLKN